jgi:hypothetical protein
LQLDSLDKIIFVSKNWPSDFKVGYSSPSSLIELIKTDVVLKKELKQYESEFE